MVEDYSNLRVAPKVIPVPTQSSEMFYIGMYPDLVEPNQYHFLFNDKDLEQKSVDFVWNVGEDYMVKTKGTLLTGTFDNTYTYNPTPTNLLVMYGLSRNILFMSH